MADQMTPAELKAAAGFAARQIPRDDIEAANLRTLADAARRLADVVEWAASVPQVEKYPTFAAGWEEAALHVLDLARGETNEREIP